MPTTPRPPAKARWQAALRARNMAREQIRNDSFRTTPIVKGPAPTANLMVQRGTRAMLLSRSQASETTRKSWQTRKETYGRKGRLSKLTFSRSHKRFKS